MRADGTYTFRSIKDSVPSPVVSLSSLIFEGAELRNPSILNRLLDPINNDGGRKAEEIRESAHGT